jgi:hypothetical protein
MAPLRQYPHIARIRSFYDKASDSTKQRAHQWYQREHDYALWLARRTGYPPRIVCACLAVLSPRCQWPRVKGACGQLLSGDVPSGIFKRNQAKAKEILKSRRRDLIDPRRAPKTWAFWQNLWHPDDPEPVTLDAWMFRAHGLPPGSGVRVYRLLADAYRVVASDLGLVPNQLQAAIWLHTKAR